MKYMKPEMYIEEFELNASVAACDRLPTGQTAIAKSVTVQCVATTSDVIFNSVDIGCEHIVDPAGGTDEYIFFDYTDTDNNPGSGLYFCWNNNKMDGPGTAAIEELREAAGLERLNSSGVWHAGPVTGTYLEELRSHST